MAKRKFGASIVILCIAAITLISGTYAWFLVGGFASLFNIGFDVIEATGGILLQGDNGTANSGAEVWGTKLERVDFSAKSFIVEGGKYKPVSSADGNKFVMVTINDDKFVCDGEAPYKADASVTADMICFNDFTFKVKSNGEEIIGNDGMGAYVKIELNGSKLDTEGNEVEPEGDAIAKLGAATAARVALTVDGVTTVYSLEPNSDRAVTNAFGGEIVDQGTEATRDFVINPAEDTENKAGLQTPVNYSALSDDNGVTFKKLYLGNIPGVSTEGKTVRVRVWLEGNDPQCIDHGERTIAGKSLLAKVTFGVDE